MLKDLVKDAKAQIDYFFSNINLTDFDNLIELCNSCKGLLIFTGVGKSGIIAEKITHTLSSTGTKALYLPTLNFLHGDIGLLSSQDLLFMLSKSGESEELLNLLPFIAKKQARTIGITSCATSSLAKNCTHHLLLPMQHELCEFNLVPTTSSQTQLIFGDILTVALMKKKKFSIDEYALNHPFGAIGKKMTLLVKDLMLANDHIPICKPEDRLQDILVDLTEKRCGALIVLNDKQQLEGIFTDGDLRRALQRHGGDVLSRPVGSLMTKNVICIDSDSLAWDAMKQMQQNPNKWVMVTPVTNQERVVGLLRMHDIIQAGISN